MTDSQLSPVHGVHLSLRLVSPDDAAFIHNLRTDSNYNTHLSAVTGTVENQRDWIKAYKKREAAGAEYYFMIERKDGLRCGFLRLYDIMGDRFTWGSWILDQNKPSKAALESAMLVYVYGFEILGLSKAVFSVRRGNERTLEFHRRFGAVQSNEDPQDIYFEYSSAQFATDKAARFLILEQEKRSA